MNLDIIVAVLGIISAILGLLTAIIQLKNATHQRRHQESQDDRNYIDIGIGKWLKRALILFGVPFAILLAYREWDSVENGVLNLKVFANNAVLYEFQPENIGEVVASIPGLNPGVYSVEFYAKDNGSFFYRCPGENTGRANIFRRTIKENLSPTFGMLTIKGRETKIGEEAENRETVVIESGEVIFSFNFPWNETRKKECKPKGLIVSVSFKKFRP